MRRKPIQTAEYPPASPPVAAPAFPYMDAVSSRSSSGLFVEATPTFAPGVCMSVWARARACVTHIRTICGRHSHAFTRRRAGPQTQTCGRIGLTAVRPCLRRTWHRMRLS